MSVSDGAYASWSPHARARLAVGVQNAHCTCDITTVAICCIAESPMNRSRRDPSAAQNCSASKVATLHVAGCHTYVSVNPKQVQAKPPMAGSGNTRCATSVFPMSMNGEC